MAVRAVSAWQQSEQAYRRPWLPSSADTVQRTPHCRQASSGSWAALQHTSMAWATSVYWVTDSIHIKQGLQSGCRSRAPDMCAPFSWTAHAHMPRACSAADCMTKNVTRMAC